MENSHALYLSQFWFKICLSLQSFSLEMVSLLFATTTFFCIHFIWVYFDNFCLQFFFWCRVDWKEKKICQIIQGRLNKIIFPQCPTNIDKEKTEVTIFCKHWHIPFNHPHFHKVQSTFTSNNKVITHSHNILQRLIDPKHDSIHITMDNQTNPPQHFSN